MEKDLKILKNSEGFTLLEVMISIAILAFIVTAIVAVTGSSQDTAIRVVEEDRQLLQVETAFSRLEWDISHLYTPLYFTHAMEPKQLTQEQGQAYNRMVERFTTNSRFAFPSYEAIPVPTYEFKDKTTFTFFTISNRRKFKNVRQSHFAWVRYDLEDPTEVAQRPSNDLDEDEPKGAVLTRKFTADNVFDSEPVQWDDIKSQVLLRNVEKLVFEFWNEQTKKWTDNLSTIKEGIHLIRGVKVTLDWVDTDGIKRTFIRVFRPLYPRFEPENMYELMNESGSQNPNNQNPNNPGPNNQPPNGNPQPGGR